MVRLSPANLAFWALSSWWVAVSGLNAGDIAIVLWNQDPDTIAFVPLVDLPLGTNILFTDKGWDQTTQTFYVNEGVYSWTAPQLIRKGVVTSLPGDFLGLSKNGDSMIALEGNLTNPKFIFALNNAGGSGGVWQTSAAGTSDCTDPTALANNSKVALMEYDNTVYNGIRVGTRASLLAAITNKNNWVGTDAAVPYAVPKRFTVDGFTAASPAPSLRPSINFSPAPTPFNCPCTKSWQVICRLRFRCLKK